MKSLLFSISIYLIAAISVLTVCSASIVALEWLRPEGYNSQAAYAIIGMGGVILTNIFGIIKSINNGQQLKEVKGTVERKAENLERKIENVSTDTAEAMKKNEK